MPWKSGTPEVATIGGMLYPSAHLRRGFTLIELMVALVIVAILAAIALPSFQQSIRKSRRNDAHEAASAVQQAQERWRSENPRYTPNLSDLKLNTISKAGYYTLALSGVEDNKYTLTVMPLAGSGQDRDTSCTTMTTTVERGTVTMTPPACWSR
jgi:type IV pilus assembly protein PilE